MYRIVDIAASHGFPAMSSLLDGHMIMMMMLLMMMIFRFGALLVLSIVLISPIDDTIQGEGFNTLFSITMRVLIHHYRMTTGVVAVLAVLIFVAGFAMGLGAGRYIYTYIHTYIHIYIHTYTHIHTYIQTCMLGQLPYLILFCCDAMLCYAWCEGL